MKLRTVVVMVAAALLALAAATWVTRSRAPENAALQPGPLAPGLAKDLDQVTQVRIVGAGGATLATISRGESGWGVAERGNYRADTGKLRSLLQALAAAQRVEAKTSIEAKHALLGVEDVSGADAYGVRVDVQTPQRSYSWIIGNNLVRGNGTYVRQADQAQSWLINSNIAVERSPANWVVREIADIAAGSITAIEVAPAKGETFALERREDDPDSDFVFTRLPKGRLAGDGFHREALAGVLSGLVLEEVYPAAEQPEPEQVQRTRFHLDDGRVVEVRSWPKDGHTLVALGQSLDEQQAEAWRARQAERAADASSEAADDSPQAAPTDPAQAVEAFRKEHAGWVYRLPSYKATNLNRPFEEYLQPAK